ncbi:DUF896 domain-containing protein [Ferviditalea candida]|uniref:UPF0291 protein VF724_13665 n=1 Tax=Ferviditalea candida TaxID=3108399 RepID=A0ABU5ZKE1_9BACL|nr:DUF896 domain-containing protein [Paenibacillaceae bacterium T2]
MNWEQTIVRINELSRKKKSVGLTKEETLEQNRLRTIYIEKFKASLKHQLDSIRFVDNQQ